MEYADVVWAGAGHQDVSKLDHIKNYTARLVMGVIARCSIQLLQNDTGRLSLHEGRRRHKLVLLLKIMNGLSLPERVGQRTSYSLRSSSNISCIFARLRCVSHSFIPSDIHLWNNLSANLKNVSNIYHFKSFS